jgi:hypothetical protein
MYWFKNVLSLNIKLYIQTEEKFYDCIVEERKKVDPELKNTIINICNIETLEAWKRYNSLLEKLMSSEEFVKKTHHNVPEMTKPLYNVLMFNKVFFLKHVIQQNPFNTKFFSWVDTGFIRDEKWIVNNTEWPDPTKLTLKENKVRFFCINDYVEQGLSNTTKEEHCMSQMRFLKGTIFFLDGSCINRLCELFDKNVVKCIEDKFIGSDEKIFDLCYCDQPNLFELVKCDWREEFHLYAKHNKKDYTIEFSWDIDKITKASDYSFWYVGIEDCTTSVIHRCDFNPQEQPDICTFKQNKHTVTFSSTTKPHRVVVWPVDNNGKWLDRLEYPIHI